jgi:asparagine synthase (glutamine-hydrolysing)
VCGIAGWVDFMRDLSGQVDTIERMSETMRNRGPDDKGVWVSRHAALGHRRLAVIDASGGRQPMVETVGSRSDPVVLVYNGEIYNFRELRAELTGRGQRFATRSDTEVVLRAYLEWGIDCVQRFNGIFALGLWDGRRAQLLLARDRIGVKPLYYHTYPGGLLFGSEPKAVLANPLFSAQMELGALAILFNPRLTMPGETPLHGLAEVCPGHVMRFSRAGVEDRVYWRLTSNEHTDDLPGTVQRVRELLEDAVARQLVADVPVCSLLSGGLDSTTMAAIASRRIMGSGQGRLRTFCVDFVNDEQDFRPTAMRPERDAPYAAVAARHILSNHAEVVLDTPAILCAFSAARRARDLPSLGQFDASMHLLFAEIRRHATVALSAEAADEIFGGYPWFHDPAMVWRDTFPWVGDAPRLTDCLRPEIQEQIRPAEVERDRYSTLRAAVPSLPGEKALDARMREVLFLNQVGPLACLLDRTDRMSMAAGLEVRVPFCDHRLVEYMWNVPWSLKTVGGRPKALLRMAARGLVPVETIERAKSGYPGTHDPAHEAEVLGAAMRIVADHTSPLADLIDAERLTRLVEGWRENLTWMNAAHLLTPILEVDIWMRRYGVRVR